jgi:ABC-2 type transport system ATP-binding protein
MARAEDRAVPTTESVARATSLNGGAPTPVIQVRELGKSYGPVEAVRGVDITVGAGEIVAFLGPNGAGKTTTMEILAGHRQRDAGEVSVLGRAPLRWDHVAPGSRRRQREPDVSPATG